VACASFNRTGELYCDVCETPRDFVGSFTKRESEKAPAPRIFEQWNPFHDEDNEPQGNRVPQFAELEVGSPMTHTIPLGADEDWNPFVDVRTTTTGFRHS